MPAFVRRGCDKPHRDRGSPPRVAHRSQPADRRPVGRPRGERPDHVGPALADQAPQRARHVVAGEEGVGRARPCSASIVDAQVGNSPTTTFWASSLVRRSHTSRMARRSSARRRARTSSPCVGWAKPAMTASCIALGSESSSTASRHASALASAVGLQRARRGGVALPGGGRVALQLGVDVVRRRPRRGPTASCSIDQRSSSSTARPVDDRGRRRAGRGRSAICSSVRAEPSRACTQASWWSEPGAAAVEGRAGGVGERGVALRRPVRVGVDLERAQRLAGQRLHDADVGLGRGAGHDEGDVVAGRPARRRGSCPTPPTSTARAAAGTRAGRCRRRAGWRGCARPAAACSRSGRRR